MDSLTRPIPLILGGAICAANLVDCRRMTEADEEAEPVREQNPDLDKIRSLAAKHGYVVRRVSPWSSAKPSASSLAPPTPYMNRLGRRSIVDPAPIV